MQIIAHRINKISALANLPKHFGVEIDVRHDNHKNQLYLNHDLGEGKIGRASCRERV